MSPSLSLALDVVILVALGAAIFHARRLSRQFAEIQADRKAFDKLIEAINNAAARADGATRALKEAAQQGGDRLQDRISAARGLADELEIIVEAGDHLARRLEALAERRQSPAEPAPEDRKPAGQQPRSRAEKELLEALRAKQQSS